MCLDLGNAGTYRNGNVSRFKLRVEHLFDIRQRASRREFAAGFHEHVSCEGFFSRRAVPQ